MTAALSQRDRELLTAWMSGPTSTTDLAAGLGIEVPELTAWANRPEIASAIQAIRDFSLARAQTFALAAKSAAVARLLQIVEHADDEQSARRAATAILRFNPKAPTPEREADHDPSGPTPFKPTGPKPNASEPSHERDREGTHLSPAHASIRAHPAPPALSTHTHVRSEASARTPDADQAPEAAAIPPARAPRPAPCEPRFDARTTLKGPAPQTIAARCTPTAGPALNEPPSLRRPTPANRCPRAP